MPLLYDPTKTLYLLCTHYTTYIHPTPSEHASPLAHELPPDRSIYIHSTWGTTTAPGSSNDDTGMARGALDGAAAPHREPSFISVRLSDRDPGKSGWPAQPRGGSLRPSGPGFYTPLLPDVTVPENKLAFARDIGENENIT